MAIGYRWDATSVTLDNQIRSYLYNWIRISHERLRVLVDSKKSPSSAMMRGATKPHTPWFKKNGDESSTEAAQVTATAVVD
jgi:hypothetical protein